MVNLRPPSRCGERDRDSSFTRAPSTGRAATRLRRKERGTSSGTLLTPRASAGKDPCGTGPPSLPRRPDPRGDPGQNRKECSYQPYPRPETPRPTPAPFPVAELNLDPNATSPRTHLLAFQHLEFPNLAKGNNPSFYNLEIETPLRYPFPPPPPPAPIRPRRKPENWSTKKEETWVCTSIIGTYHRLPWQKKKTVEPKETYYFPLQKQGGSKHPTLGL